MPENLDRLKLSPSLSEPLESAVGQGPRGANGDREVVLVDGVPVHRFGEEFLCPGQGDEMVVLPQFTNNVLLILSSPNRCA